MKTRNKPGTEYQIINLSLENGQKRTFRVHRLVLMAFQPIDNMENFQVNHKDGDKKNNNLDNLEWCTAKQNIQHSYKTGLNKGRKGERSNFSKLKDDQIKLIFDLRQKGWTQKQIADKVHCSRSNISYILNKKNLDKLKVQRLFMQV